MVDAIQEVAVDVMGDSFAPELDGGSEVDGSDGDDASTPDAAGDTARADEEVEDVVPDEVSVEDTSVDETTASEVDEADTDIAEDTTVAETADTDAADGDGVDAPEGFVYLAGGTFLMGGPAGEPGREGDEVQRVVTVSAFFIKATEVTRPSGCAYSAAIRPCSRRPTGTPRRSSTRSSG